MRYTTKANLTVGGLFSLFVGNKPKMKHDSEDWEWFNLQWVGCWNQAWEQLAKACWVLHSYME